MPHRRARALGSPVRYDVFRRVAAAGRPIGVAELAEATGLTANAVRAHLAKLVEANLVVEVTERRATRGRPRTLYLEAPGEADRWAEVPPYQELALLLTEVVATADPPRSVGRRAGRRLAGSASSDPVPTLVARLAEHGFAPCATSDGSATTITVAHCPFAEAAEASPEVICDLHRGLVEGMTEALAGERPDEAERVELTGLEPRPPRAAGCRFHLRTVPPGR